MIKQEDLVAMCKSGDQKSYTGLYNAHATAVYNTILRLVKYTDEAEDILQESFVAAFQGILGLKENTGFRPWVKRIAINKSIDLLRKRKLKFIELDSNYGVVEDDCIDEEAFEYTMDTISEAIAELPDAYRTVFNLYVIENIPQAEIAQILGIEHTTVRTQYHRAKHKILNILKEGAYREK